MDNLEDDGLREVFSKLRGYESKKSGITWASVSKQLGSGGFSKAVILPLTVLIVAVPAVLTFDANTNKELVNDMLQSKVNSEAEHNPLSIHKAKTLPVQVEKEEIHSKEEKTSGSIREALENEDEKVQSVELEGLNDIPVEKIEKEQVEQVNKEQIQLTEVFTDTVGLALFSEEQVALAEGAEITTGRRPISIAAATFYAFGVVEPLPADDVVLTDYQSKVGYGVNLNMMIPIYQNRIYTLDVGPAYKLMRKGFDFNTNDFGSEKIEHTSLKRTLTNHFVGVGLQFGIRKRQMLFGSTIMKSVNGANTMNHYTGSAMLFLDATKEIKLKHENRFLQLGLSSGIPISGPYTTFKYFPIQLSVGIRNAVKKD